MPHFARSIVPCSGRYSVTSQPRRASACGHEPATSARPPTFAKGAASAAANATRNGGIGRLSAVRKKAAAGRIRARMETPAGPLGGTEERDAGGPGGPLEGAVVVIRHTWAIAVAAGAFTTTLVGGVAF